MEQPTVEGVFRTVGEAGWFTRSAGSAEFATGYFSVVGIPEIVTERVEMRKAVFFGGPDGPDPAGAALFDTLEAGWYFVMQKGEDVTVQFCSSVQDAITLFREADEAFTAWANS